MLSPGDWYKIVPKTRDENLTFRRSLLDRCERSKRYRDLVIEACHHDILFYCNAFVVTYDPRTPDKALPFITYPYQDDALLTILDCIEVGRDLVMEKSRDMGATWKCMLAGDWLCQSQYGTSGLCVSRKEDLVDAVGDPDCLFWKIDWMHSHLPEWLLGPDDVDRRRMHFEYKRTRSTFDGEATTAAAGVGGRRTWMFIDEFSRIEQGYQLLAGTADTTRCRVFNFTPFGTANAAFKLAKRGDIRKLRMHWSAHPIKAAGLYQYDAGASKVVLLDKTFEHAPDFKFVMDGKVRSPWYDDECRRRANDREIAVMLDIDYQGSAYQFFDKTTIIELQRRDALPPFWEGDVTFDERGWPKELVKVHNGPLKLWLNLAPSGTPPTSRYAAGADISSGTGATNSCLSIVDAVTGHKVASYTTPFLRPEQFAPVCTALCRLFVAGDRSTARFAWEMQGPGVVFGKEVIRLGYRNIYFRQSEQKLAAKAVADTPGWFPSPDNKRTLLEEYRAALATRRFVNHEHDALEECLEFIHTAKGTVEHQAQADTGDDPSGAKGNHGDRVVADALAWKMARELGGGQAVPADPNAPPGEIPPGCLAFRLKMAENAAKQREAS